APKPIRIAGYSRAEGVEGNPNWTYSIYLDLKQTDGTAVYGKVATFRTGSHDWEQAETIFTPAAPIASATVHVFLRNVGGTAWFDDLFVGEDGGPNLLRCAGFEEEDRVDPTGRRRLLETTLDLHANALHIYLPGSLAGWEDPRKDADGVRGFLEEAATRGIGAWLTVSEGVKPIRDAKDPNFPQYYCVNGSWGRDWVETIGKVARFPLAGLSMVPDEYNWNNGRLAPLAEHRDPEVKAFYQQLGTYCTCPDCRASFRAATGHTLPAHLPARLATADETLRRWLTWRYDCANQWLARSVAAAKAANAQLRTDSLICVTPLCSDFWYGPGVAWDRAGYEAGLEYPTTDPYILLHNYLGDSTHWYVTETTEHLAGASPQRRCGVVLEASRLRHDNRELAPVERYGAALSAVWHGARELAWFHLNCLTGDNQLAEDPAYAYRGARDVYQLLEQIDSWFADARPLPGVALLFSRASCDWWRFYAEAKPPRTDLLSHASDDPRAASVAQKEVLYYLLRQGYPTTLYYLDSVGEAELAEHPVVVVPFPYAISDQQAALLERLAAAGKQVVVVSEFGSLDETGQPRPRPALLDLLGLPQAPRQQAPVKLTRGPVTGEITCWTDAKAAPRPRVTYLPGAFGLELPVDRSNERKGKLRVLPPELDPLVVAEWRAVLEPAVTPLLQRELRGDDVELAARRGADGATLLLAINWSDEPRLVPLPQQLPYTQPAA
ncbi:MAG: hypothetical protein HUU35_17610, partial [Armatimonadetes bacterium]|nr:hypothetical protein [Armatimonadota bacterium]